MESRAKVEPGSGEHSVCTHFPKDPHCDICLKTKITRAPCRKRTGTVVPRAEKFGDLITADHKILSEGSESRNNHRYAVVAQDLAKQWLQSFPCKTKTFQETQKSLVKFLEPTRKPKVIYTDNSLQFGKSCEELSWNHCTSTPHRSETHGIAERVVRRVKEGTSAVLLQSGLVEKWWADSMECYCFCETFKISCLMGRHHMKGGSECSLIDQWYRLEQWSNITLSLRRTCRDCINSFQKSCQVFPRLCIRRGENLERRHPGRRQRGIGTDGRIWNLCKKTQRKGSVNANERWQFICPITDGRVKLSGRDRRLRTSTLIRDRPERGEGQEALRGESDELSSPNPLQDDSTLDDAEAINDFRSITGDFIYRHHVEPRFKLYVPKEESFPVPLTYIDVTRTTHTSLDVLLENTLIITGTCMEKESDAWTTFILLNKRALEGYTWTGWRLTMKQTTSRPDNVWPDMCVHMSDASKRKAKQNWAIEKLKLGNARQLRGLHWTWGWRIQTHHQKCS